MDSSIKTPIKANQDQLIMGHLLEPVAAYWYQQKTGNTVYNDTNLYQHADHPWALVDFDLRFVRKEDLLSAFSKDIRPLMLNCPPCHIQQLPDLSVAHVHEVRQLHGVFPPFRHFEKFANDRNRGPRQRGKNDSFRHRKSAQPTQSWLCAFFLLWQKRGRLTRLRSCHIEKNQRKSKSVLLLLFAEHQCAAGQGQ